MHESTGTRQHFTVYRLSRDYSTTAVGAVGITGVWSAPLQFIDDVVRTISSLHGHEMLPRAMMALMVAAAALLLSGVGAQLTEQWDSLEACYVDAGWVYVPWRRLCLCPALQRLRRLARLAQGACVCAGKGAQTARRSRAWSRKPVNATGGKRTTTVSGRSHGIRLPGRP